MLGGAVLLGYTTCAALGFGGFVVAKAQGEPSIAAASLVLVHDDRRTVLTIAADYHGPAGDVALIGEHVAIEFVEELGDRPAIALDDLDTLGLADLGSARRWRDHDGYEQEIYSTIDTLVLTRMRMRVTEPVGDIHLGPHQRKHAAPQARPHGGLGWQRTLCPRRRPAAAGLAADLRAGVAPSRATSLVEPR